jgi:hypothetical protein
VVSPPPTRSELVLARLHALPRLTVPAIVLVLTVAGLLAPPPIGVPCLVILAAFLGWLAWLAWPKLDPTGRLLRALVVGMLVGAAIARGTGALA